MIVRSYEHRRLAQALSSSSFQRGRKCQRKNLVKRLRAGRPYVELSQTDVHLVRQARLLNRVGRVEFQALHTKRIDPFPGQEETER